MNIPFDLDDLIKSCPNLIDGLSQRTQLNLCGHIYEISTELLDAHPHTLLGVSNKREQIFYHRHPSVFSYVLSYYILGYTQKPNDIPSDVFNEECRFFSIPYQYDEDENFILNIRNIENEKFFQGKFFRIFSFIMSFLSCVILFFNQLPKSTWITNQLIYNSLFPNLILNWIEIICSVWFMIEFYLRFYFFSHIPSQNFHFQLFIDMISILPIFFSLLIETISRWFPYLSLFYPFYICLKSFRVFRLIRHIPKMNLILQTIALSLHIFTIPFILSSLFLIPFGIIIYLFERTNPSSTIIDANMGLSWAIETLTTIGFGEYVPQTYQGRCLSIFACIFGLMILTIPIPILFQRFQILHQNSLKRELWIKYM